MTNDLQLGAANPVSDTARLERDVQTLRAELAALRAKVEEPARKPAAKPANGADAAPHEFEPMTPEELQAARETFGLTKRKLAEILDINARTVRTWEVGTLRKGSELIPAPIPKPVALLIRAALKHPAARKEMGIP